MPQPKLSPFTITCEWCGTTTVKMLPKGTRCGLRFCDRSCSAKWRCKLPHIIEASRESIKFAHAARRGAPYPEQSVRMREKNPMRCAETRARVSASHRASGFKPVQRGGNGHPPPLAESRLAQALGAPWELHVYAGLKGAAQVALGVKVSRYEIDIAHREMKIAVEVDGGSHAMLARKASDARKDEALRYLGWRVFRVKNSEVLADPAATARRILSMI